MIDGNLIDPTMVDDRLSFEIGRKWEFTYSARYLCDLSDRGLIQLGDIVSPETRLILDETNPQ